VNTAIHKIDTTMQIGVAADHAGFQLKEYLRKSLTEQGYEVLDFGNDKFNPDDDFPDYVVPLAMAIIGGEVTRGIAICGSGVGACIVANKVAGIRACLVHEEFSARQGVEDDDMNMLCLGARVIDKALALTLSDIFLAAKFVDAERHNRRLAKIIEIENIKK
jgi:ribose 5-phosphate isomerase B